MKNFVEGEESMSDENEAVVENEGHVSPMSENELAMPEVCLTIFGRYLRKPCTRKNKSCF